MIPATTFTPYYCEAEDRIRLVVNYADFTHRVDFWITRAFLLKLLPSMEEYLYTYTSPHVLTPSQATHNKETTPTDSGTLAVMEKEGILLEAVDMTYTTDTGMFEIRMRGKNVATVAVLSEQMMMAVIQSIFGAAPHMHWGISPQLLDYRQPF
ncbi:MAG TPA: hypothetical protein PLM93_09630 [Sulfuricurvum sp.]|nr:MAG: hypothetical protein B7Y30_04605 [Campylobacterales bacterium 16-40-21]OZA02652.1 MAG: hypothetical protein B7X89_08460 [Sulfuricurvum sp. 17-40-25]HQS67428.1 hypothetical protein [Sulfuricurvum sp.]HQT36468.1 hypothetical protein [Sulfuricurvum sp.]